MSALRNVFATMIGTRIAADAKNTGLIGVVVGLAATRIMTRSPLGALVVGGGYVAHKLLQKKQKIDLVGPRDAAEHDGLVDKSAPRVTTPGKAPRKRTALCEPDDAGTKGKAASPRKAAAPVKGPVTSGGD